MSCSEISLKKEEPLEVIKCVLKSDALFNSIADIIELIQTKQLETIITKIFPIFFKLVEEIKKCMNIKKEESLSLPRKVIEVVRELKKKIDTGEIKPNTHKFKHSDVINGLGEEYINNGLESAYRYCIEVSGGDACCEKLKK